jgi:hypothetical protein
MTMDEFGLQDGSEEQPDPPDEVLPPTVHEERKKQPPPVSPTLDKKVVAPFAFADALPLKKEGVDEVGGGCCKCIIM